MLDPDTQSRTERARVDTGALRPDQLSDHELQILLEIESRIVEDKTFPPLPTPIRAERYLKRVEKRHPRALLLAGGRGTGKTSMLLTLVERWHHRFATSTRDPKSFADSYAERIEGIAREKEQQLRTLGIEIDSPRIPKHIRVLEILDFDPLPPGMPLIAGIMQAWRPLAETFDQQLEQQGGFYDGEGASLMDLWNHLFHTAAVGWGKVSHENGLIEQVLDRQDQVQHWQRLGQNWQEFVWKVLKAGKKMPEQERLPNKTVFVIMIDDCDLQVERIRQLLPALRMLYHPRVFFVVAADQEHMLDMLKLDFYGQQRDLAREPDPERANLQEQVRGNRWASTLARSSFDKVFPSANRWEVKELSLLEFLAFPELAADLNVEAERNAPRFIDSLNKLKSSKKEETKGAGDLLLDFARASGHLLPRVMTYRQAEHLNAERFKGSERGAEILARLVSQSGGHGSAVVHSTPSDSEAADFSPAVEVRTAGEVAALFRPGLQVPGGDYNIFLSTRPDFVFIDQVNQSEKRPLTIRMSLEARTRFSFTGALAAKTLDEAGYPIDASGLVWNTFASHIWTEWPQKGPNRPMLFRWPYHEHPRPNELFDQARDWRKFVDWLNRMNEPGSTVRMMEWLAYGWVYYQRCWSDETKWSGQSGDPRVEGLTRPEELDPEQVKRDPTDEEWEALLNFDKSKEGDDRNRWTHEMLPLLARPEIGLSPKVQDRLLSLLTKSGAEGETPAQIATSLERQRERFITDAIIAASVQLGANDLDVKPDEDIKRAKDWINSTYEEGHGKNNPWKKTVTAHAFPPSSDGKQEAGARESESSE